MLGTRYKTGPLEQALQESFGSELLFGGQHDDWKSYLTKVAVTPQRRLTGNSLPNLEVGPAAFGGTFPSMLRVTLAVACMGFLI